MQIVKALKSAPKGAPVDPQAR